MIQVKKNKLFAEGDNMKSVKMFMLPLLGILLLGDPSKALSQTKFKLEDFKMSLNQITSAPQHVWVNSGYTTVQPRYHTVMGVDEFYSPPFAAKNFRFSVEIQVDTLLIQDVGSLGKGDVGLLYAGGDWYPHKIVRRGTYHHLKGDRLLSLAIRSQLLPLFGRSGFLLKIAIKNRSSDPLKIAFLPKIIAGQPTFLPLNDWAYGQPKPDTLRVDQIDDHHWKTATIQLCLFAENNKMTLPPNTPGLCYFAVLVDSIHASLPVTPSLAAWEKMSTEAWSKRLVRFTRNIPMLESDIPGLKDYYYRSLLSGLVCIWENPAFKVNPHVATSGMDGGAMCTYLWDTAGYAPHTVTCMLDSAILPIARQMVNIDLEKYYAFAPGGAGVGVRYSYSPNVFARLVSSICQFLGEEQSLFEAAKRLILDDEKKADPKTLLIDYGEQKNLLEMRGAGWEHVVVSPNAERVWCLNELSRLGAQLTVSHKLVRDWQQRAMRISQSIKRNLWDEKVCWWKSIYPNGFVDYVYSIQAFDALWTGVCDADITQAMLVHLRPGTYLGEYGVSSVSMEDSLHYEVVDTDWSGGGAFTGDGPQLALILYTIGKADLAWEVLKRHFWMGKYLLYYPQEHYCDKPMSPAHKRANVIAGLCGAEAILFGLVGLQPDYGGALWIDPKTPLEGSVMIRGFGYRQNRFDIELRRNRMSVFKNGDLFYDDVPRKLRLL